MHLIDQKWCKAHFCDFIRQNANKKKIITIYYQNKYLVFSWFKTVVSISIPCPLAFGLPVSLIGLLDRSAHPFVVSLLNRQFMLRGGGSIINFLWLLWDYLIRRISMVVQRGNDASIIFLPCRLHRDDRLCLPYSSYMFYTTFQVKNIISSLFAYNIRNTQ